MNRTFILRFAVAIILLAHALAGMFNNGINDFGNYFLNEIGFSPVGVPLAWAIKISHVICAILLIADRYIKWAAITTILILIAGIILVHFKEGWFVVGGGRNGVEYNFLLICVLVAIMYPNGINKQSIK
ncbi:MAG: DoxX family membrane protein [Bacteroidia bacterium]